MIKLKTMARRNTTWDDHNKRVARVERELKELEDLFPQKFKHPKIGRYYHMDRENGMHLRQMKVEPAIEIYERPRDPSWPFQVMLAILMVVAFIAACYAIP